MAVPCIPLITRTAVASDCIHTYSILVASVFSQCAFINVFILWKEKTCHKNLRLHVLPLQDLITNEKLTMLIFKRVSLYNVLTIGCFIEKIIQNHFLHVLEQFLDEDFSNPGLQRQPKDPISSTHTELSPHISEVIVHSFTSTEQLCPVHPVLHRQEPFFLLHSTVFWTWQSHCDWQFSPNVFPGHSVKHSSEMNTDW